MFSTARLASEKHKALLGGKNCAPKCKILCVFFVVVIGSLCFFCAFVVVVIGIFFCFCFFGGRDL